VNVSFEVLSLTGVAGQKLWAKIDVDNQSNRSHTLALLLKERFSLSSGSNFVDKESTVLKKKFPAVRSKESVSSYIYLDLPLDIKSSITCIPAGIGKGKTYDLKSSSKNGFSHLYRLVFKVEKVLKISSPMTVVQPENEV